MINGNFEIDLIDSLEHMNFVLSLAFVEKWRHRTSEEFIKRFQMKIMESINKPIKLKTLYNYLTKKCNYSPEYVTDFLEAIDIELCRPFIYGPIPSSSS